ncbi:uncharacterized protein B0H18DRAFT_1124940 [Fomitopsis serialis]|uniref:uncharacterized protein n=1 Tax=Fomitopsis serialis TaxID=139415 RepID=UPI0020076605|nr:uncharacterized protein B0H18DRAFT_1124940 [Neoantrodia serialis]KAH9915353.1 hypothetical protein B0H18DRAFT_1124940 [Neoantrodia serialis]
MASPPISREPSASSSGSAPSSATASTFYERRAAQAQLMELRDDVMEWLRWARRAVYLQLTFEANSLVAQRNGHESPGNPPSTIEVLNRLSDTVAERAFAVGAPYQAYAAQLRADIENRVGLRDDLRAARWNDAPLVLSEHVFTVVGPSILPPLVPSTLPPPVQYKGPFEMWYIGPHPLISRSQARGYDFRTSVQGRVHGNVPRNLLSAFRDDQPGPSTPAAPPVPGPSSRPTPPLPRTGAIRDRARRLRTDAARAEALYTARFSKASQDHEPSGGREGVDDVKEDEDMPLPGGDDPESEENA